MAQPVVLNGNAESRGRQHAAAAIDRRETVRAVTVANVEKARADGLLDDDAQRYLAAQRAFHDANDPMGMAELRGIAAGFELSLDDLFAAFHMGMIKGERILPAEADGCSSWAVADGPDGPLVVKNRDTSTAPAGLQQVTLHTGPDIAAGNMLCVGSAGAPACYSSGINGFGFALADTHIPLRRYSVGWHRFFLMGHLLANSRSVDDALATIRSVPHVGGGSLTMADRSGAIATVEFSEAGPSITMGAVGMPVHHTNTLKTSPDTTMPTDSVGGTSEARYAYLESILPTRRWDIPSAKELMSTHVDAESGSAPLCQHMDRNASITLSAAIYACAAGTLDFSSDNPCLGNWNHYSLPRS